MKENSTNTSKDIYLKEVLGQVPRLLGLLDRNVASKTYGCFDRQYWHYHISDFSCARSQEAVLTLALLYTIAHPDNLYYRNELVLEWINASLKYWTKIQASNGSFSEWYPNENSFVATAFTTYAVSETILLLENKIENRAEIIKHLESAANWLLKKDENTAQNQESGALIGLYNVYLLTRKEEYKQSVDKKISFMTKNQKTEGWFSEYGGADIGYLSLAIDYLSKYYKKSKDERALKLITNAISFIKYFIHPNFTAGGEYGSRNTEYIIPDGFEILAKENEDAAYIAWAKRKAIENNSTISAQSYDDRYLSYTIYTYLQAYLDASELPEITPLYEKHFEKYFTNAGLYIKSTDDFYFITNLKKGGAFKLFYKKLNKAVYDSGIAIESEGESLTSSWLDHETETSLVPLHSKGSFWVVSSETLTPAKNILLRSLQASIGKSESLGLAIKNLLRSRLITKTQKTNTKFSRSFKINEDSVEVEDSITNFKKIKNLYIGSKSSYIYIPSAKYFQTSELDSKLIKIKEPAYKNEIKVSRKYNLDANLTHEVKGN